ncbi:hypothetical protein Tco_0057332 [Tanacetum coccineum]
MTSSPSSSLPLIITLNCIEDTSLESQYLSTLARVEHVPLHLLADSNIEQASAVLLHSLAFLPRAAQRRLRPYQLILCLGSADRAVDSAIASDLGLGRVVETDAFVVQARAFGFRVVGFGPAVVPWDEEM